jgi:succinate dehydrogenase / fumarate reductase cytochrome b subunit
MHWFQTSLGKKYIMAVTGLGMVGYVVIHMIGNLSIYAGPGAINAYAEKLHQLPPLLWGFRFVLLVLFLAHICTGVILYLENRRARPVGYARKVNVKTSFPAETMIWSGLLLAMFVVYHLLHFTLHITNPDISNLIDTSGRPDVFAMVALSFIRVPISVGYIAAMVILLSHLYHGIQSLFQSLGLNTGKTLPFIEKSGRTVAFLLLLGFVSIPITFLFAIMKI